MKGKLQKCLIGGVATQQLLQQSHNIIDMFYLRVWFCLRGMPIRLRLFVQVVRTLPLISLRMVLSGSY